MRKGSPLRLSSLATGLSSQKYDSYIAKPSIVPAHWNLLETSVVSFYAILSPISRVCDQSRSVCRGGDALRYGTMTTAFDITDCRFKLVTLYVQATNNFAPRSVVSYFKDSVSSQPPPPPGAVHRFGPIPHRYQNYPRPPQSKFPPANPIPLTVAAAACSASPTAESCTKCSCGTTSNPHYCSHRAQSM